MPGPDDEHPFLTPKGLRLQQQGRKLDNSVPMELPVYPPLDREAAIPLPTIDPFEYQETDDGSLHNILPSRKFPRPESLGRAPLSPYYQTRLVPRPEASGWRAIGKLFIQVSPDTRAPLAMGSAWITGASTIATAAHNLFDVNTGTWSQALEFHPGYDYYAASKGPVCRVTGAYLPRGYLDNPATNLDIAICYVDRNIGDIVGAKIEMKPVPEIGYFDRNPVTIVGYPAGSGFDFGKQMWQSEGDYLFGQGSGPGSDFAPVMATNLGGGASGCPWVVRDAELDQWVAIGVTSGHAKLRYHRREPSLASLVSPYFGPRLFDQLGDQQVFHQFLA